MEEATKAYAYIRKGEVQVRGNVKRIDLKDLANYLFNPVRLPTFNEHGKVISHSCVPREWPFKIELPEDATPDELRDLRAELDRQGYMFTATEVSKEEYEQDRN